MKKSKKDLYISKYKVVSRVNAPKLSDKIYGLLFQDLGFENLGKKIDCDRCLGTGVGPTGQCTRNGCRRGKIEDVEYDRKKSIYHNILKRMYLMLT